MGIEHQELKPTPNFPREIGFYLSGMEEVREQLREAVKDLSAKETSAKLMPNVHSIGQLILHNAEAEWWWIECVVSGTGLDEEKATQEIFWDILDDDDFASKNYSSEFCVDTADEVRSSCFETLKPLKDEDLDRYFGWTGRDGKEREKTLRWILHHLIDHEAQHKGQILMLKRLIREETD